MDVGSDQAWVTLATNDSYALGALVLARSLRRAETTRKIVIMITHGVSDNMKAQLSPPFDEVVSVELLDSDDPVNLELLERPELGITFTKIHCWKLTQFSKCVFLDADTMVLKNCDELFDREEFSAAPDAGWPDCFNSGVFVFVPSLATFTALTEHAKEHGSFDGGDQGLLNTYFSSWATKDISKHLPFLYNMVATATYTYLPAYKRFGHNVKVVHFIGVTKPWHVKFDAHGQPLSGPHEAHTLNHLQQWWRIFFDEVKPKMAGIATVESIGAKEPEVVEAPAEPVARAHDPGSADNREDWEVGRPDYMGSASFDNIMKKIETSLQSPKADVSDDWQEKPVNPHQPSIPQPKTTYHPSHQTETRSNYHLEEVNFVGNYREDKEQTFLQPMKFVREEIPEEKYYRKTPLVPSDFKMNHCTEQEPVSVETENTQSFDFVLKKLEASIGPEVINGFRQTESAKESPKEPSSPEILETNTPVKETAPRTVSPLRRVLGRGRARRKPESHQHP